MVTSAERQVPVSEGKNFSEQEWVKHWKVLPRDVMQDYLHKILKVEIRYLQKHRLQVQVEHGTNLQVL